jgi:glycosyltransferase involved in cell wall biosynthesis
MGGPLTARARRIPTVLTAHGPVTGELGECYRLLSRHHPMVAISESQRANGPHLPWAATVHNAIPVDEYPFETEKDDFVLFLGRISPEKGPDLAIRAARAAGRRIVVAAKCNEPAEHVYFEERVRPLLGPDADWYGHATTEEKKKLLARASALVFPIQWDEPFGIVMVEAMACGTPVVALRAGSVPEVVVDGLTGYICDRPEELPVALQRVDALDPKTCREHVLDRFDVPDMVEGYEAVYRRAIARAATAVA